MVELLLPADPELATIAELTDKLPLNGFPALTQALGTIGTKLPTSTPKPPDFVRVLAVGGTPRDLVSDLHTVTVEGWSLREQTARDLTALAVALIEAAARTGSLGGVTCYEAGGGLPANLPHPTVTSHFRFTATLSVALRRTSA